MTPGPLLFTPIELRGLVARNRVVVSPMLPARAGGARRDPARPRRAQGERQGALARGYAPSAAPVKPGMPAPIELDPSDIRGVIQAHVDAQQAPAYRNSALPMGGLMIEILP